MVDARMSTHELRTRDELFTFEVHLVATHGRSFGGTYRADAAFGQEETHVQLTAKQTKILGHSLELGRGTFVIRK